MKNWNNNCEKSLDRRSGFTSGTSACVCKFSRVMPDDDIHLFSIHRQNYYSFISNTLFG